MADPRDLLDQVPSDVPFIISSKPGSQFAAIRDDKEMKYGTDGDMGVKFDSTRRALNLRKDGQFMDFDGADLSDRVVLVERFNKRPALNNVMDTFTASVTAAEMVAAMIANKDFEVLGVNMTTALVTFDAEGGIKLTTAGADGDEGILLPHLSTNQSQWAATTWGTEQECRFEAYIKTGASVAKTIIWAGFKLTNTEVVATDDNQCMFRYEDDVNSAKWQCISSRAGVDTSTDSGAAAVVASTVYHLVIDIDSSRIPRFYINGILVVTGAALTDVIDLIPYVGVGADGAAPGAKVLTVRWMKCSRKYA